MKRLTALLAAFAISAAFVSCGKEKARDDNSEEKESSISETTEASEEHAESEAPDGTVTDERLVGIDLSQEEVKQVRAAAVKGDFSDDTYIENLYMIHALHTNVVGLFGCPIEIISSDFTKGELVFEYNPDDMKCVPPKNLIILHYNEEECCYDTINSSLNSEKNLVKAYIYEPGVYMLADAYEWYGVWGEDVSRYAHDVFYSDPEYGFNIVIPQEIRLKYVSDYLKDDDEGKCKTLLECYSNDEIQIGIEYLERPDYSSAQEYIDILAEGLESNGYLEETGTISCKDGSEGFYFFADFGQTAAGSGYSINCLFPIDSTRYINIWYGFTDISGYDKAVSSLESFEFYSKPQASDLAESHESESETAVTTDNIYVEFPDGLNAAPVNEDWEQFGEMVIAPLFEIDCAGYSEYLYDSCFELVKDEYFSVHTTADTMESEYDRINGMSFVERASVTLSSGNGGEIICVSRDGETGDYGDTDGVYDMYGFFETDAPDQYICLWFTLDKNAPPELYQELYDCIASVDIR